MVNFFWRFLLSVRRSISAPLLIRTGRNPFFITFCIISIITIVSIIAAVMNVSVIQSSSNFPLVPVGLSKSFSWNGIVSGIIIGAVTAVFFICMPLFRDELWSISQSYRKNLRFAPAIITIIFIFLLIIFIAMAAQWFEDNENFVEISSFLKHISKTSDNKTIAFLAMCLGFVGFYMSLLQLRDFHNRLFGFDQLSRWVGDLVNESSAQDKMHVITYTPAIGYFASHASWKKINDSILKKDSTGQNIVKMLTQNDESLLKWHTNFIGRKMRRFDQEVINADKVGGATEESTKVSKALEKHYFRVNHGSLPGFYCFFNSKTAIIVTPMFLPFNSILPTEESESRIQTIRSSLPAPHLIGYRTNDQLTIHDLYNQFEYIIMLNKAISSKPA